MFKSLVRAPLWRTLPSRSNRSIYPQRFFATRPACKKKKWKATIAKLSLAFGGIYYYYIGDFIPGNPGVTLTEVDQMKKPPKEILPTIDTIFEEKKQIRALKVAEKQSSAKADERFINQAKDVSSGEPAIEDNEVDSDNDWQAGREGAFDPETGTINWDCPCLGGMAHGPCGGEFKDAFSCFVYSKEDPKGVECIDRFKTMQNCFRQYPEIYGAELDEEPENETPKEAPKESHESSQSSKHLSQSSTKSLAQSSSQSVGSASLLNQELKTSSSQNDAESSKRK